MGYAHAAPCARFAPYRFPITYPTRPMLTGDLKSKIDQIWNAFWSGGIANPIEVIEQITYLLFLRRLDDLHTLEENKATRLKKPMERLIYPEGTRRAALAQLDALFASLQQRAFAGEL
jgi:hypothetical protein